MAKTVGIDISHWNGIGAGGIRKLYNAGAVFIIAKSTQRTNYVDPAYLSYARQMDDIPGVIPGAYHWLTQHDGKAQARHFVGTVRKGWAGRVPEPHIWAVDIEKPQFGLGDDYCSWDNFLEFVREFKRLVPGSPLWVYTRPDIWVSYWRRKGKRGSRPGPRNPNGKALGLQLWNAYWVTGRVNLSTVNPNIAKNRAYTNYGGWKSTPIQQITSSGYSTVGGRLDIDVFDGTPNQLRNLLVSGSGGGDGDTPCPDGYQRNNNGDCVPKPCPDGYHRDASGTCVPNGNDNPNPGPGTDPWSEPWFNEAKNNQMFIEGTKAGTAVGTSVIVIGGLLIVGLGIAYYAMKSGGKLNPIIDTGEKD